MRTRRDIEAYLARSNYSYDELDEGTWLVYDRQSPEAKIVLRLEQDLVLLRLRVLDLSRVEQQDGLFEKLLTLNASDMVHGAYGIADGAVVITAVLRLQTLDLEELIGTIDDFTLALSNHRELLAPYRERETKP